MALGLSPSSLDDLGWVVKVGSAGNSFGVLVDHLDQVVDLNIGDISAGTGRKGGNPGLIRGVTVDAVTVLDGTAILGLHSQER